MNPIVINCTLLDNAVPQNDNVTYCTVSYLHIRSVYGGRELETQFKVTLKDSMQTVASAVKWSKGRKWDEKQ